MKNSAENQKKTPFSLGFFVTIVTVIFLFGAIGGDIWHWMSDSACYRYLGCNAGFFGYDAVVHFVGGILIILSLTWLMRRFPSLNILHTDSFSTNFIILLGLVALIGVGWETIEFIFDHWRMVVLHENLINPNRLAQPSNGDTMGDLVFGLFGGTVTMLITRFLQ